LTAWAKEDIIFANMGVEDEFGPDIPASRVLNNKEPLNFILPEPTLLRYIDPAMALSNAGAAALLSGSLHPGLNIPDLALEDKILADVRHNGIINAEITRWEAMNTYE
jgi:adenosylhomocysteinase